MCTSCSFNFCPAATLFVNAAITKLPRHNLARGGGGGGGDSHMKWTGMFVVSLRGVNFVFWSRLGCSGQNVIIFSRQDLV